MPAQAWRRTVRWTDGTRNGRGPEYALLAWLLGQSDGGELSRAGIARRPDSPPLYTT